MTRLVQRFRSGPYLVTVGGEIKAICGCGLSGALPFCDGTHQITKTETPGKLHWYDSAKQRHYAVDKYPNVRSDEMTPGTPSTNTMPSINTSAQAVSER